MSKQKTKQHRDIITEIMEKAKTSAHISLSKFVMSMYHIFLDEKKLTIRFHKAGIGSSTFSLGCVTFLMEYPPRSSEVVLRYRHMDAYDWNEALQPKNTEDLIGLISTAVDNPPHPISPQKV